MKTVVLILSALLVASPVAFAASSGGGAWTIGPNLGFSVASASGGGGSVFHIGWPNSGLLFGSVQPGMRIGYVEADGGFDLYFDTGVDYANAEGSSFHSVLNTVNFQLNFSPSLDTTPFVTAGGGMAMLGFEGDSETHALLGLGFGVRRRVSEGHGAVRTELRFDRMTGADGGPTVNSFAVKIGVDLWLR